MAYQRLTMDEWNIQQRGCLGWETVCTELSAHRARVNRDLYRESMPEYAVRIKPGRFYRSKHSATQLRGFEKEAREGRQEGYDFRRLRRVMRRAMNAAFHQAEQRLCQPNFMGPMYIGS